MKESVKNHRNAILRSMGIEPTENTYILSLVKVPEGKVICPVCKNEVEKLTKDHIIPKWFARRFPLLVGDKKINNSKTQPMCFKCNQKKGGQIDFTDEFSREYVKKVISVLQKKLDDTAK